VAPGVDAAHTRDQAVKTTVIVVTAGKPSELAFKLSKTSGLAAGKLTFKVTNRGAINHDFKICTSPTKSATATSCVGKTTKLLKPGQSASLTVTLNKAGKYEYLCTVPGHAGAGMRGLIGVGVKVAPAPTPTPAPTPSTSTTTQTQTTTATCASPQSTTVTVDMFEYGFTLSQKTVPCGTVTFNEMNTGQIQHDFVINGVLPAGILLNPGQSTTDTYTLGPGAYGYVCDVPTHANLGMEGTLTVTG